jgi:hypothetical protein
MSQTITITGDCHVRNCLCITSYPLLTVQVIPSTFQSLTTHFLPEVQPPIILFMASILRHFNEFVWLFSLLVCQLISYTKMIKTSVGKE